MDEFMKQFFAKSVLLLTFALFFFPCNVYATTRQRAVSPAPFNFSLNTDPPSLYKNLLGGSIKFILSNMNNVDGQNLTLRQYVDSHINYESGDQLELYVDDDPVCWFKPDDNDWLNNKSSTIQFTYYDAPMFRCFNEHTTIGKHAVQLYYYKRSSDIEYKLTEPITYEVTEKIPSCDNPVTVTYNGIGDIASTDWKFTVNNLNLANNSMAFNAIEIKIDNERVYMFNATLFGSNIESQYQIPVDENPFNFDANPTTFTLPIPKQYTSEKTNGHDIEVNFMTYYYITPFSDHWKMPYSNSMCGGHYVVTPRGTPAPSQPTPPPIPDICKAASSVSTSPIARIHDVTGYCSSRPLGYQCADACSICPGCKPALAIPNLDSICLQIDEKYKSACETCMGSNSSSLTFPRIWTAIGCLPASPMGFINEFIFGYGIGIAGSIAFLYFLYGSFVILTSAGNPERVEEAKQIITSSIAGLILIIFSVFLLKIIGVNILNIPGFSQSY